MDAANEGKLQKLLSKQYRSGSYREILDRFAMRTLGRVIEIQEFSKKKTLGEYKKLKTPKKIYFLKLQDQDGSGVSYFEVEKIIFDNYFENFPILEN